MTNRSRPFTNRSAASRFGRSASIIVGTLVLLGGCDTGDGKTLPEATGTLPPPTTTTLPEFDNGDGLPSIPLEPDVGEFPDEFDGDDFDVMAPWVDGGPMDIRYTCDGLEAVPPLSWSGTPVGAAELAVVMIEDQSPDTVGGVHWVMAGLDPAATRLVEDEVPVGAVQAVNSFGSLGWTGPCPTADNGAQTYRFTVYALGQQSEISDGTPASDAIAVIESVAFSSSDVLATYER